MYLDRDWKLMLNRKGEAYRLFDVKNDPEELEDLVGQPEHSALIKELKTRVAGRLSETA
jgi:arylsulfatase A-like enzyme